MKAMSAKPAAAEPISVAATPAAVDDDHAGEDIAGESADPICDDGDEEVAAAGLPDSTGAPDDELGDAAADDASDTIEEIDDEDGTTEQSTLKRPAASSTATGPPPLKRPAAATSAGTPEVAPEPSDTDE
eukprot:8900409-Pyramimonas_sp.AAC.1